VKTRSLYLTWSWTTGQTDRQNYHS